MSTYKNKQQEQEEEPLYWDEDNKVIILNL